MAIYASLNEDGLVENAPEVFVDNTEKSRKAQMDSFVDQDSFCVAPWLSLHVDTEGFRKLCCISEKAPREESLLGAEAFRNGNYLKNIRQKMISGVLPDECVLCRVSNRSGTYRESLNSRFHQSKAEIQKNTREDGTIFSIEVKYLDYRAHVCNFSCKTCGGDASSKWAQEIQKNWPIWREVFSENTPEYQNKIQKTRADKGEFLDVLRSACPELIYFAGGEPLMSAQHWQALDYLIDSGKASGITLNYNTNLGVPPAKIEEWARHLSHFKSVEISCSLDGVDELGEYIRAGLNYSIFLENLSVLRGALQEQTSKINLDATLTSLLLIDPIPLAELALAQNIPLIGKIMVGAEQHSLPFRCEFLPNEIRDELFTIWNNFFHSCPPADQIQLESFHGAMKLAARISAFGDDLHPKIRKQILAHDLAFGGQKSFSSFMQKNKKAAAWLQSIP